VNFEELYNLNFKYVYRFFYYKSVAKEEIEDLTHEVFIRFYAKFKDYNIDQIESKKILFGFCCNIYKEHVRKSIKENRVEYNDLFEYDECFEEFVDDEMELKLDNMQKLISECLPKLNPKVRAILECRFLKGMTRKETAAKFNITEKDVHTYQKRGVRYLKKMIK
jgi:RNA polymerase sigma-70 factor (ECF subfamily)